MVNRLLSALAMTGGLLAGSLTSAQAQIPEPETYLPDTPLLVEGKESETGRKIYLGVDFKFRVTQEGEELSDFLELDRATFEKSMPGFRDFLKVGDLLPTLGINARFDVYDFAILPRDRLQIITGMEFSSSSIFGKLTDKKTFDASVQDGAIHLGPTPTTWEQKLKHYVALGAGIAYVPHKWGRDYTFFPLVEGSAYLTHMNSESKLHIHVTGDEESRNILRNLGQGSEEAGWAIANQLDVYEDIKTDASTKGLGFRVEGAIGAGIGFPYDIEALLRVSYIGEWQPGFRIRKITDSDSQRPTGKIEDNDGEEINNTLHGFSFQLGLYKGF